MEAPALAVDSGDLALAALEGATHDLDGVAFADGDASHVVLGSQFLIQVAAHDLSPDAGGSGEVRLPRLSALAGHALVGLHLSFSLDS